MKWSLRNFACMCAKPRGISVERSLRWNAPSPRRQKAICRFRCPAPRTCSTRSRFCFRTGCWRTAKRFTATPNAWPLPQRAPMIARWAPARWPAARFRWIAMLSRAIWDFPASPPIASTPSATATSRSNFFSRFPRLRCISRGSQKILCFSRRPSSVSSSCLTNFPPAAA